MNGTTLQSFWASISYILCIVVTQPLYTTISDVFGRKPPFFAAFLLFAAGSLVFALAQNMTAIIVGRVLQGLGGGGLDLLGEIIVADMTTLQERPLYLGLMALPIAMGTILGPTLGAIFSSFVSWRWIGWINLPLLGVAFLLVFFFLRLRPLDKSFMANMKRLDWGGIFLSLTGITVFVVPLSWAGALYPWKSWQTILPLLLGAALLAVFAIYESRPATPIMPHRLFRSKTVKMTLLGNFMHGAMLFSLLQYLPFFYQAVKLQTPIETAVTLLPTSIISVIAAASGVIAVGIMGRGYKWSIRLFWIVVTLGSGLLGLIEPASSRSICMGLPVLWGAGIGALMRLLHLPMQASVTSVNDTGLAIGILLSFRLLGGLIGLAVGSTVFSSVFAASIASLGELPPPLTILKNTNEAISFIPKLRTLHLPRDILDPVLEAYLTAMRAIFYAMTGFGAIGLASSMFIEDLSLQKTDLGSQRFE
jgi:MFS family permease